MCTFFTKNFGYLFNSIFTFFYYTYENTTFLMASKLYGVNATVIIFVLVLYYDSFDKEAIIVH